MTRPPPRSTLFPYTPLSRSLVPAKYASSHLRVRVNAGVSRSTISCGGKYRRNRASRRSEEHTSELQSHLNLVCRLLLEKKKKDRHRSRRQTRAPSRLGTPRH